MNVSALSPENNPHHTALTSRILVVDDVLLSRTVTEAYLRKHGFHDLETAENGQQALEKAAFFKPDLIVLDLEMPVMDGYQCCKQFRELDPENLLVPVLIQTGHTDTDKFLHALRHGANDIISKPITESGLVTRVQKHMARYHNIKKLLLSEDTETTDDALAQHVQQSIIPTKADLECLKTTTGLNFHALLRPCEGIGGDYWGVMPIGQDKTAFYLFDFSGHGLSAATSACSVHLFMEQIFAYQSDPAAIFTTLNAHMQAIMPFGRYAVGVLVVLDRQNNSLTYAGAGTLPPILAQKNGVMPLDCSGTPLGLFADARYETRTAQLQHEWSLALYSDALLEPGLGGAILLNATDLNTSMGHYNVSEAAELFGLIENKVKAFEANLQDDLTFILISKQAV